MDQSGFGAFCGLLKSLLKVPSASLKDRINTAIRPVLPRTF